MRIECFPETDSLYIELSEVAATDSWQVGEGIIIDVDCDGHPVGIDIDQASRHFDLRRLDLIGIPVEAKRAAG